MQTTNAAVQLDRLEQLTRRYARFSRSAGGLGTLLGGVLCLIAYFAGALLPLDSVGRVSLASLPLVWIAAKELLRRRLYQRHGRVCESRDAAQWRWHAGLTCVLAAGSAAILWFVVPRTLAAPQWPHLVSTLLIALLPVLAWFYLWAVEEFVVGVFLICQAAVVVAGFHYPLGSQVQAPLMAGLAIAVGWRQHREFRAVEAQLAAACGGGVGP